MPRCLAVVVGLAACGAGSRPPADAALPGVCDPLPYDPYRYLPGKSPSGTWAGSRTYCQSLGMDLAVIDQNEPDELMYVPRAAMPPTWWGVSYDGTTWQAIDG